MQRHGELYAREYGYDAQFEALVAAIAARFVQRFDAAARTLLDRRLRRRERRARSSSCGRSADVAKLRLLLVEPEARGRGLGARLVGECIRFARRAGYRSMVLWTQSELAAARHVYERAGFRCARRQAHHSFGRDLVAETWRLAL